MVAATIAIILAVDVVLGSVPNSSVGGTGTDKVILFAVTTTTSTTSTSSTTMPLWFLGFDEDPANLTNLLWNTGTYSQHGTNGPGAAAMTWVASGGGISAHVTTDGSADYGRLGFGHYIQHSDSFTVAAWVFLDGDPSGFPCWSGGTIESGSRDGRFLCRFQDSTGAFNANMRAHANSNQHNADTPAAVTTGAWHHVALIYDNNDTRVYQNGQFKANDTSPLLSGSILTNGATHDIAVSAQWAKSTASQFMDGKLDDYYFHNKALSHTNVYDLWLNTKSTHGG